METPPSPQFSRCFNFDAQWREGRRTYLPQGHLCSPLWSPLVCGWRVSCAPIYQERSQLISSVCMLLNSGSCIHERGPVTCQLKHLPWLCSPICISPASHSFPLPWGHQPLPNFGLASTPPTQRKKVSLGIGLLIHNPPIKAVKREMAAAVV